MAAAPARYASETIKTWPVLLVLFFFHVNSQDAGIPAELRPCPRSWEWHPYACPHGYERTCDDGGVRGPPCPTPLVCCSDPPTCQVRCLRLTSEGQLHPEPRYRKSVCPLAPAQACQSEDGNCPIPDPVTFDTEICREDADCQHDFYICCPNYVLKQFRCIAAN